MHGLHLHMYKCKTHFPIPRLKGKRPLRFCAIKFLENWLFYFQFDLIHMGIISTPHLLHKDLNSIGSLSLFTLSWLWASLWRFFCFDPWLTVWEYLLLFYDLSPEGVEIIFLKLRSPERDWKFLKAVIEAGYFEDWVYGDQFSMYSQEASHLYIPKILSSWQLPVAMSPNLKLINIFPTETSLAHLLSCFNHWLSLYVMH